MSGSERVIETLRRIDDLTEHEERDFYHALHIARDSLGQMGGVGTVTQLDAFSFAIELRHGHYVRCTIDLIDDPHAK